MYFLHKNNSVTICFNLFLKFDAYFLSPDFDDFDALFMKLMT